MIRKITPKTFKELYGIAPTTKQLSEYENWIKQKLTTKDIKKILSKESTYPPPLYKNH